MARVDQAARYLVKRNPPAFFGWAAPCLLSRWQFHGFVDTSTVAFPGEPNRVCDTVAEFVRTGERHRRLLLDVESQSEPHPDMLERLGEYAYRLRRERRFGRKGRSKYGVLSVLLNLTGRGQPRELDMTVEEVGGAGAKLIVVVRTLREEDAAETLAQTARGELSRPVLPWVALMHGAGQSSIIREWKRLAEQEPDTRWRSELAGLALVFAELAGRKSIWHEELRGWDVKELQVILDWQAEAIQDSLLRLLRKRFAASLPSDLETAIRATYDHEQLNTWIEAAGTVLSLPAFRTAIGQ
jgi:hypothetical protein